LKDSGHEVYWIDIFDNGAKVESINWVHQTINWKRRIDFPGRQYLKMNFPILNKYVSNINEIDLAEIFEKKLKEINPDVVQSFVLFSACAPILEIMNYNPNIKWIYSAWGNDLYFFQNEQKYLEEIKSVLPRVDYMFADCFRDYLIAKKYGFKEEFLGVYPGGGGFDFQLEKEILPASKRNIILIKGYQDLFGECIPVLKAVQQIKNELKNYEVIVFGAEKDTVEYVRKSDLINYVNFTLLKSIDRGELMKLMGKSLIYVGNSISDGMPNTLLESIIMGAFPIQSNPGGATEELIKHKRNGFLIHDPYEVNEIKSLILKSINNRSFLAQAVEYNFKNIKPKLERKYVRKEVLEKYSQVEKAIKS
jgi:hypothetical protein